MIKVVALDISSHAGFAVMSGEMGDGVPELIKHGVLSNDRTVLEYGEYPWCYWHAAEAIVDQFVKLLETEQPDHVVIEETNLGRSRYTQKLLEWIHHALLTRIRGQVRAISYLSSSAWRSKLGLVMSREDKKNNAKLSKAKRNAKENGARLDKKILGIRGRVNKKHLAIRYVNNTYGLKLKVKDNDIADAIGLGLAFFKGAEICDGI